MQIISEIKKIAAFNTKRDHWIKQLELRGDVDLDGLFLECARLIDGCKEKNGHLYRNGCRLDNDDHGPVDDQYYCHQMQGYCEDDFYGTLYFKTNVPGQFVEVPFHM